VSRAVPEAELALVPLADGGEGTVEAFVTAVGGEVVSVRVTGPLGRPVDAFVGVLDDGQTAVIEMAAASGLPLVPEELRNPLVTTSYGTGELIRHAIELACERIILGIGGSATNDGGVGMIQALGGSFRDENGEEVGFGGRELVRIRSIDLSGLAPVFRDMSGAERNGYPEIPVARQCVALTVACDVDNPLTGPRGASAVFGPQKGATPEMVAELDAGLRNLAEVIRRDVGVDVENVPGAGAAGGMGAAAAAFLGAQLKPGIEIVMEVARFDEALEGASLVITGEGRVDGQTLQGKCISGVLSAARARGVPVVVLGGSIEPEGYGLLKAGAAAVLSIVDRPMTLAEACTRAGELLERAGEQVARMVATLG